MDKDNRPLAQVAPKIRAAAMDWWLKFFENKNSAASWALEEIPYLVDVTLARMRGRFSRGELMMMVDVLNGHQAVISYMSHGTTGHHIGLSIMDSFEIYPGLYEEKWGVGKDTFLDKLRACTRWELACLELWIAGFWNGRFNEEKFMEDWLNILLEDNTETKGGDK